MKSAFILVSSFLLVAAVHGSVLLESRANDQGKDQGKGNDSQNPQGGNGTFLTPSDCANGASPQGAGSGVPVTPPTNQSSNGAPPPKCFNLTASDGTSGSQPSFTVQFNNASSAQGNQPPSNQTASPNGDNNSSSGGPQFQFCPSSGDSTPPFTNGTTVSFQEVPCPNGGDQNNGTPPANGADQNANPDGTGKGDDNY